MKRLAKAPARLASATALVTLRLSSLRNGAGRRPKSVPWKSKTSTGSNGWAGAQVSPDGEWVAYTVSTTDLEKDESKSQIWMVSIAVEIPSP